ncbi:MULTISPECIES: hypothetical protein [Billgrantia]|uniref:MotA/TolQ/ExbB proton channel domain-containing protein n=1 Tax=Billgrantia aerodenitrificans TaxID=2733483 RepID=A0ABS9AW60_9GAMM|nr:MULTISPECIES: hypothetical protein [Halomonas]MCE8013946.1 hypothetical protein [Halomonas desiderata]MCE8025705.1 hypothetical protein [Halomonas aerodenitrificans]
MEQGQLIHAIGWSLGVFPAIAVMIFAYYNRGELWRISNLLSALLLIGLAVMMVGLLGDLVATAEHLHSSGRIEQGVFQQLQTSGAIWLLLFPAVVGGVGVNLLSSFLTSKKP